MGPRGAAAGKPVQLLSASQRRQTYESLRKLEGSLPGLVKAQDFRGAAEVKRRMERLRALDPYYELEEELDKAVKKVRPMVCFGNLFAN